VAGIVKAYGAKPVFVRNVVEREGLGSAHVGAIAAQPEEGLCLRCSAGPVQDGDLARFGVFSDGDAGFGKGRDCLCHQGFLKRCRAHKTDSVNADSR
jgi:hypothetical protein